MFRVYAFVSFAETGHTKVKLMNICRNGQPKKCTLAILVFPLGQNMSAKLLQQVWFISFAGKNDCFATSRQFTSITSLSDGKYYKFRAIVTSSCPQVWTVTKENILNFIFFFLHSFKSKPPIFVHFLKTQQKQLGFI